jgi:hypothetical protein
MKFNQRKTRQPTNTTPTPKRSRNHIRRPTHNIGIDFWHAVEFSSVGHAPSHDFRHAPGQPLKLNPPNPADPNRCSHQVVSQRFEPVAASVGNFHKLTHPAFPLQIALFTVW